MRCRAGILGLVLFAAVPAPCAPAAQPPLQADQSPQAMNDAANALARAGQHAEALDLYDRAIAIERAREPRGRLLAVLLSNSAAPLQALGREDEALDRLEAAEKIFAAASPKTMGFSSAEKMAHERGSTLYRMGGTLAARRRHADALNAFQEALVQFRNVKGADIEEADCLTHMGLAQAADPAQREIAVDSLEQAVTTYEKARANTPTYTLALVSLGGLLAELDRLPEAARRLLAAVRADWTIATESLPIMSERERPILQLAIGASADSLYSLVFSRKGAGADAGLEAALLAKGMLYEAARLEQQAFLAHASETFKTAWRRQTELRSRLAALTLEPALRPIDASVPEGDARDTEIKALREQIASIDAALRADNETAFRAARLEPVAAQSLLAVLRPNQALVEFIRYRADGGLGPERYGAFVAVAGKPAAAVDLGPAAVIDSAIADYRHALEADIARFKGVLPSTGKLRKAERALAALGADLRTRLLDPLAPHLAGATRLYISPDAAIGLVPFEALPLADSAESPRYLIEAHQVVYLTTPRDLLRAAAAPAASAAPAAAVLIGDPRFNAPPKLRAAAVAGVQAAPDQSADLPEPAADAVGAGAAGDRAAQVPPFGALPPTGEFLASLKPLLEAQRVAVSLRTGADASEEAVSAAGKPRLLQFATHGYFTGRSRQTDAAGPAFSGYVRSMLILAGANQRRLVTPFVRTPAGISTESEARAAGMSAADIEKNRITISDGLLTGLEVLGMDLSGTELVGLTACETGLGETLAGEGVIGLRRAFLQAGAASVVSSLWEVPLNETLDLHRAFYAAWLGEGRPRFDSFHAAKASLLASVRAAGDGIAHPFYWAGFVYAGDPGDAASPAAKP